MCGIFGYLSFAEGYPEARQSLAYKMESTLFHRGRDSNLIYFLDDKNNFIGHTRLSIIDLSGKGTQPLHYNCGDKTLSITYNGEIYNFKELRQELKNCGYEFTTQTDTEVILLAYHKWKENCVSKFNGMFAFVIYDERDNSFFIARDRFGTKPLYYIWDRGSFLFASEIKALLEYEGYIRRINLDALSQYFTFQNVLTDETLFDNIHLFPAGHFGKFSRKGLQLKKFWDWDFNSKGFNLSFEDTKHSLRELFQLAVKRQLISDVPISSYLSGGMDSGSIAAVAGKNLNYKLKTFTCGFNLNNVHGFEASIDERNNSEIISHEIGSDHYNYVINHKNLQESMEKVIYHLDDPKLSFSYPNFYIANLASKYSKVCLSGVGGDELFGGYPWRYKSFIKANSPDSFCNLYYNGVWNRLKVPDNLFPIKSDLNSRDLFYDLLYPANKFTDYFSSAFYFEAKYYLQGFLLVGDRLSMANTMEERFPFLDNDLVDFAMKIPVEYKLNNLDCTDKGKYILRQSMKGLLPDKIIEGDKKGFIPPEENWFRNENYNFLKDILLCTNKRYQSYISKEEVSKILKEHKETKNHRLLIWGLLSFSYWCEIFKM